MSNETKSGSGIEHLLKRHWFTLLVAIIAIVFIVINRTQTKINFLFAEVDTSQWLALTVAAVLGLLVGVFLGRK
ncbi:LapA family protein [Gordonia sp. (in: high G+C Gram-positive bacteria)]|uniref:LapA family protein n=1 Tax=Gordonia sp. (in: high G+C Gram-positive bacteria) TaxID=84139 RepID=UPI0039E5A182